MRRISERIEYLAASREPLSADVGVIHGDRYEWIFDVGSSEAARRAIEGMGRVKNVVLSHFHPDHTGNLSRIACNEIYCGGFTRRKFGRGTVVDAPVTFEDGARITVFPLPCSHAKGAVGLQAGAYAFLGDGAYAGVKDGRAAFNAGLLKETIAVLRGLEAEYFLLSHDERFVKSKAEVLAELEELYGQKKPGETYLFV